MNNKFYFKSLILTLLCLLTSIASSSTLQIMYQLALENDPQFQAAQQALKVEKEYKKQGRAALLPDITFAGSYSDNSNSTLGSDTFSNLQNGDAQNTSYSVSLSQDIFNLGVFYGYKQIIANTSAAEARYRNQQQDIIVRTSQRYFAILRAIDFHRTLAAEQKALQQQLQQTQQSYEVGLVSITDVHDAQTSIDLLSAQIIEAKGNILIEQQRLVAITGEQTDKIATIKELVFSKPEPANISEWLELAEQNSHTLTEAQQQLRVANFNYQVKRSAHFPTVSFGYQWSDSDLDRQISSNGETSMTGSESTDNSWRLSLNMPLFTGGRISSERRVAYYQKKQQDFNLELTRRQLIQNVQSAFLLVHSNDAQIKAYQQAIKSSNSALESTQAGYQSGTRNLVDVLTAQRNVYQAERNYSNARYDYLVNTLQLKYLTGILGATDVNYLDSLLNKTELVDLSIF